MNPLVTYIPLLAITMELVSAKSHGSRSSSGSSHMALFGGTPTRSGYVYRPAGADPHDPRWRGNTLGSIIADTISKKDRKKKGKNQDNDAVSQSDSSNNTNETNDSHKKKKKKKKNFLKSLIKGKKKKSKSKQSSSSSTSSSSSSSSSKKEAVIAAIVANKNNLDQKTQSKLINSVSSNGTSDSKSRAIISALLSTKDNSDVDTKVLLSALASNKKTSDEKHLNSDSADSKANLDLDDSYYKSALEAFGLESSEDSCTEENKKKKTSHSKKNGKHFNKAVKTAEDAADKEFKDISKMFGKRKHRKFHRSSFEQVGRVSLPPRGSPIRTVKLQYKDKKAGQQCRCVCQV